MPTVSTMQRGIDLMANAVKDDPFSVDGFLVILDDPTKFNSYTTEHAEIAGFLFEEGMPMSEEFFYCTGAYEDYLQALTDKGLEHPANKDKLPWV